MCCVRVVVFILYNVQQVESYFWVVLEMFSMSFENIGWIFSVRVFFHSEKKFSSIIFPSLHTMISV